MAFLQQFWLRLSIWCEARILPFRIGENQLAEVLAIADGPILPGLSGVEAAFIVHRVRRTTRRPWLMADRPCLREGILAFRFLRAAGYHPELHFGVDPDSLDSSALRAHCWIVLDGKILLNPPDEAMVTILRHTRSHATLAAVTAQ